MGLCHFVGSHRTFLSMYWDHEPAFWHRLRGAVVFAALPEVSAIAATSGYCLSTLRVEEHGSWQERILTRKRETLNAASLCVRARCVLDPRSSAAEESGYEKHKKDDEEYFCDEAGCPSQGVKAEGARDNRDE